MGLLSWVLWSTATSTRLRKVVTGHAVLTFVFNTVIIALMVSALTA
ncbi:MAG: hypothetical protein ACR2GE_10960 [Pseudonocardia sp.]